MIIGLYAFLGCLDLLQIYYQPDSDLHTIGRSFISIPKKVTYIGKRSFAMCSNLDDVKIPPDLKIYSIDEMAFTNTKIESFVIHRHVIYIHKYVFQMLQYKNYSTKNTTF